LQLGLPFVNPFLLNHVLVLFFVAPSFPAEALQRKCRTADREISAEFAEVGPNIAFLAGQ
jgi:hypothetical protein